MTNPSQWPFHKYSTSFGGSNPRGKADPTFGGANPTEGA
jgi:hypothetical protein